MSTTTQRQSTYLHEHFRYTPDHHAQYERLGYCTFDTFLSKQGLDRCCQHIERMLQNRQSGRPTDEIFSAHQQEPWMFELATEPAILDMIEHQIGPNIVLWASHMLCKPPHSGMLIPWHQDVPYWNVSGPLPGGLWIPFDDVDASNGAMAILPGWHNKGILPRRQRASEVFDQEIDPSALPDDVDAAKFQYDLKAGQLALHHTMIPHHSYPNESDRWRRVLVFRFMTAGGDMGPKAYEDYRTGENFDREYYLVRGKDVKGRGLKTSPFG